MPCKSLQWFWKHLSFSPLFSCPPSVFLLSAKPVTLMSCVQSSSGPLGFHRGLPPSWYSAAFDVVPLPAPCGQTSALASWTQTQLLYCILTPHINRMLILVEVTSWILVSVLKSFCVVISEEGIFCPKLTGSVTTISGAADGLCCNSQAAPSLLLHPQGAGPEPQLRVTEDFRILKTTTAAAVRCFCEAAVWQQGKKI